MRRRFTNFSILLILLCAVSVPVRGIGIGPSTSGTSGRATAWRPGIEAGYQGLKASLEGVSPVQKSSKKKIRIVNAIASDFVYEDATGKMYATISSRSPRYANSVVEISPKRARVIRSIPVAADPALITLAGDGRSAYIRVGVDVVQRIDLTTGTVLSTFEPKIDAPHEDERRLIVAMAVVPGQPDALVVSFVYNSISGTYPGTAIYDNGVRRPQFLPSLTATTLIFDSDPTLLHLYDSDYTHVGAFFRVRVSPSGLALEGEPFYSWGESYTTAIRHEGLFYLASGRVVDVERRQHLAWFTGAEVYVARNCAIDPQTNQVVYAYRTGFDLVLLAYDLETYRLQGVYVGSYYYVGRAAERMAFCGSAGLAMLDRDDGHIGFYPRKLIRPVAAPYVPPPTPENGTVRRIPISHWDYAVDAERRKIHVGVPGGAGVRGNSIVTIDPQTGSVSEPLWLGSEPGVLRVAGDRLYVGLWGSMDLARITLPQMQIEAPTDVETDYRPFGSGPSIQNAAHIEPIPGQPRSVAVLHAGFPWLDGDAGSTGVHIYDDGVKRVRFGPSPADWSPPSVDSISVSGDGSRIYGLNNHSTNFDFSVLSIRPEGVALDGWGGAVGSAFGDQLHGVGDKCYTDVGIVFDGLTQTRIGQIDLPEFEFPWTLATFPDPETGLLYLIIGQEEETRLYTYDLDTLAPIGAYRIPGEAGPAWKLGKWADGQLAYSTLGAIVLVPITALVPIARPD